MRSVYVSMYWSVYPCICLFNHPSTRPSIWIDVNKTTTFLLAEKLCINCFLSYTCSYLFILYLVGMNKHKNVYTSFFEPEHMTIYSSQRENTRHTNVGHACLIILSPCLPFRHFGSAPLTGRPVWPLITLVPLPLSAPISLCLHINPPTHHWTVNTQCLLCATIPPSLSGMCDMGFFFPQIYWAEEVQLDELLEYLFPFSTPWNLWMKSHDRTVTCFKMSKVLPSILI